MWRINEHQWSQQIITFADRKEVIMLNGGRNDVPGKKPGGRRTKKWLQTAGTFIVRLFTTKRVIYLFMICQPRPQGYFFSRFFENFMMIALKKFLFLRFWVTDPINVPFAALDSHHEPPLAAEKERPRIEVDNLCVPLKNITSSTFTPLFFGGQRINTRYLGRITRFLL